LTSCGLRESTRHEDLGTFGYISCLTRVFPGYQIDTKMSGTKRASFRRVSRSKKGAFPHALVPVAALSAHSVTVLPARAGAPATEKRAGSRSLQRPILAKTNRQPFSNIAGSQEAVSPTGQCISRCCEITRRSSPISSRRESMLAPRLRHQWTSSNARFLRANC
jgi:hypothetical protein